MNFPPPWLPILVVLFVAISLQAARDGCFRWEHLYLGPQVTSVNTVGYATVFYAAFLHIDSANIFGKLFALPHYVATLGWMVPLILYFAGVVAVEQSYPTPSKSQSLGWRECQTPRFVIKFGVTTVIGVLIYSWVSIYLTDSKLYFLTR